MSKPLEQKDVEASTTEQKTDLTESAKAFLTKTHTVSLPGWAIALMGILIIALIFD